MLHYTSTALIILASVRWMVDNGFDNKSILHQSKVSGNSVDSWVASLTTAGMTQDDYVDYIAEILGF